MLLEGRVAVVAGVGPGMGRDIALALARHGAKLAIGARRAHHVDDIVEEVRGLGGEIVGVSADVTNPVECEALANAAVDAWGGIDVLVCNAAHGGTKGMLADSDPELLRPVLEVNLIGTLNMVKAAVDHLRQREGGRIIIVNSNVAEVAVEGFGAYGASKAALLHAAKHLANELGPDGIRVNSVLPGAIWGRGLRKYFEQLAAERGVDLDDIVAEQSALTSLGYLPHSGEIAGTVVFLASDLSLPVTGQAIRVDCGQWSRTRSGGD